MNEPIGRFGILEAGAGAADGVRDGRDRFVLADDAARAAAPPCWRSFSVSPSISRLTGMPVHR